MRRIFMFAMTVLVAALLVTTSFSPLARAAEPEDAVWKGDSIIYDRMQYFPAEDAKAGESHGLPAGTKYYVATEESNSGTQTSTSNSQQSNRAFVIYFSPGVDPPTATSAEFTQYDISQQNEFSNRQGTTTIVITPQGDESSYSSCEVESIGWVICPVTIFLAEGMDTVFNIISGFVAVQPLTVNDVNSPLHVAWNVMRSFANIAFIILFLIIIYSQLTSWGLSNYGLKRLLPRLVVAAILVNLSFYITALAVDISNVIGFGLQDILINIRETTFSITNQTYTAETTTWATAAGAILSGGAIIAGGISLSGATAGSITAALYMIVPLLMGLLLTAVFVMLILAARQAIIIILIVISPLAFVANLLPNTEKWFDKWRDLFMNMLLFFPAFSLVFGGSQLAGGIIIQNATGPFGFVMMLFGMAVQIAPLIITPLILKLSGGLLGRIAQIVNDPRKGAMDRTKNWASDKAGMYRARKLSNSNSINPLTNIAQKMDRNKRYTKRATDAYEHAAEANAYETDQRRYEPLHTAEHSATMRKERVEADMNAHTQREINTVGGKLHMQNVQLELSKTALSQATKATEASIEEYRARYVPAGANQRLTNAINAMAETQDEVAVQEYRLNAAKGIREENLGQNLLRDTSMRMRAGGNIDPQGADTALASAVNSVRQAYNKSVEEARAITKHFNLSAGQRQKHALGEDVVVTKDGVSRTFTATDVFTREAVIEDQLNMGTVQEIEEIVKLSGSELSAFKTTINATLAKSGIGGKAIYMGGQTLDDIAIGNITGDQSLNQVATRSIVKGKFSAKVMSGLDPVALARLYKVANNEDGAQDDSLLNADDRKILQDRIKRFVEVARETLNTDERDNVTTAAFDDMLRIAQIGDPTFTPNPTHKANEPTPDEEIPTHPTEI